MGPLLLAALLPASAAQWSYEWTPAPGDGPVSAAITPFKHGKSWAYAIEIDDGPKWVRTFAVPFLAGYHYTDAPPGVAGGKALPFVASVSAIAGSTGFNDANVNWDDLVALQQAGWGIMNHSFDHRGRSWDGPAGELSDEAVREDAFWSQAVFAAGLGGRAPSGAVYANGYTDYNRHDALAKAGVGIATRVGGSSTRDVTSPAVKWLDFTRSYLDEGVWAKDNNGATLAQFPGTGKGGPAANSLVVDFTHGIEQKPESANQKRWRARLETIERQWGAGGADTLWCAPTADIADYVHAAQSARVSVAAGRVTVSLPGTIPGSALTLRLSGIGTQAVTPAPAGGALYRQGESVVLTTPVIGQRGALPPAPRLKKIYDGPAVSVDFAKPEAVAGVTVGIGGCPKTNETYRIAARTTGGEKLLGERTLTGGKWVVGSQLCAIVPAAPAVTAAGITVQAVPEMRRMIVWAVDPAAAPPAGQSAQ